MQALPVATVDSTCVLQEFPLSTDQALKLQKTLNLPLKGRGKRPKPRVSSSRRMQMASTSQTLSCCQLMIDAAGCVCLTEL